MFQKILVAIDNADNYETVFKPALTLAKITGAHLMLLHILSPDEPKNLVHPTVFADYHPTVSEELIKRFHAEQQILENHGLTLLRSLTTEATSAGVPTEFAQNKGDAGRLICAIAQDWKADLIAVGRRGYSGLNELLLGSVSNYVLHHAPCSVLVIQNQANAQLGTQAANEVTVN